MTFFFEKQLQHAVNPTARTLSPLDPQALCAWGGANSTTKPLALNTHDLMSFTRCCSQKPYLAATLSLSLYI